MKSNIILHVEDDPNDVLLVGMAFRKAKTDCKIVCVSDGECAIQYLAGEGVYADRDAHPLPALILMDLKLPRKSGLEILRWLRSQPDNRISRLPAVMLTSSNQPQDIGRAYDHGVNSYLVKPADLLALVEIVRSLCQYWLVINTSPEPEPNAFRAPAFATN